MKKEYGTYYLLITIIICGSLFSLYFINANEEYVDTKDPDSPLPNKTVDVKNEEKKLIYGYDSADHVFVPGRIKWGQTLSSLLKGYSYPTESLSTLSKLSKNVWNVRRLKAGDHYTIVATKDSVQRLKKFVYHPNKTEDVIFNLDDTLMVQIEKKDIEKKVRILSAHINSSLYETILALGTSPELVNKLVDVFAWQVDFFRINRGDSFRAIFEELYVEDELIGIGRIEGAKFNHWGKNYYAIYFEQDSIGGYYDEEANSLRKTFLRAPLNYKRISSRFSRRRFHPVLKRYKAHLGTDYAAPRGTPIHSTGEGIVMEARYKKNNGNYVKIKHNANFSTQYLHMSRIAKDIKPGVHVKQKQIIGYVGSTGLATGPHLCYRFWKNGQQVDALRVELPPSEPVKAQNIDSFRKRRANILQQLMDQEEGIFYTQEDIHDLVEVDPKFAL